MLRHALTLDGMGEEVCWMLVQQAIGITEAKSLSNFMDGRVALLMFIRQSLPERLCVTAAVRQMGGTTVYHGEAGGVWREEITTFQQHLLPIFAYYLDCLYAYGISVTTLDMDNFAAKFPVINAGSPDAHPIHALADIAVMLKRSKSLEHVTAAWVGCANGTLQSLVEATKWFPYSLRIALPPQIDAQFLQKRVKELGTPVIFVKTPAEAVKNVEYIYAGCQNDMSGEELKNWSITPELLKNAYPDVKLMLSASPIRAIPIAPKVLSSKTSLLSRQAEYRLRVHKRVLHWVFE